LIEAGDVAQLKKFLHSFWAMYDVRGWYPAGIALFEQAVKVMRVAATPDAETCLGWLLAAQGLFSIPVADNDKSIHDKVMEAGINELFAEHGLYNDPEAGPRKGLTLAQNGVQILKRLGQFDEMMVIPLISLFITASQLMGQEALAVQAAQECLEVATQIDDQWAIAKAKQFLAVRAIEDGDYTKAERLAHEAYRAFEDSGNNWSSSVVCIEVLGLLAITQRQYETAKGWIERGLKAAQEIDFKYSMQTAYWQLGYVAALEEKYPEAGIYWQKAMAVSERMLGGRSFIGLGSAASARKLL
jgi:tetratricopeptide (TPR) repeat protein